MFQPRKELSDQLIVIILKSLTYENTVLEYHLHFISTIIHLHISILFFFDIYIGRKCFPASFLCGDYYVRIFSGKLNERTQEKKERKGKNQEVFMS